MEGKCALYRSGTFYVSFKKIQLVVYGLTFMIVNHAVSQNEKHNTEQQNSTICEIKSFVHF